MARRSFFCGTSFLLRWLQGHCRASQRVQSDQSMDSFLSQRLHGSVTTRLLERLLLFRGDFDAVHLKSGYFLTHTDEPLSTLLHRTSSLLWVCGGLEGGRAPNFQQKPGGKPTVFIHVHFRGPVTLFGAVEKVCRFLHRPFRELIAGDASHSALEGSPSEMKPWTVSNGEN